MLHPIKHTNRSRLWCGPAAIAAITGLDTQKVHKAAQRACGKRSVGAMWDHEILKTLRFLGWRTRYHCLSGWLTVRELLWLSQEGVFIVKGHAVAISSRSVYPVMADSIHKKPVIVSKELRNTRVDSCIFAWKRS